MKQKPVYMIGYIMKNFATMYAKNNKNCNNLKNLIQRQEGKVFLNQRDYMLYQKKDR